MRLSFAPPRHPTFTRDVTVGLSLLLLCTFVLIAHVAAGPDEAEDAAKKKEEQAPQKPTAAQLEKALKVLQTTGAAGFLQRFDALDVIERARDKKTIQAVFDSAVNNHVGAYAVRCGEVANSIDAQTAVKVFDEGSRRLRQLPLTNAVRFLGEIRYPQVGEKLRARAKHKAYETRMEALYGIVKLGNPDFYPTLVGALKAPDHEIKVPAAICCGLARVEAARPLLIKGLDDTKEDYSFFCAWALGQIRHPKDLGKVIASTRGKMTGGAGASKAKAIVECAFDPDRHIPKLLPLLGSREALAGAAAEALGRIAKGNKKAADALTDFFLDPPALSSLRRMQTTNKNLLNRHVGDALGRIGDPEHGARILQRFQANPGAATPSVIKVIGQLKTPGAAAFLQQMIYKGRNTALKKRAAIAFWECADRADRNQFQTKLFEASQPKRIAAGCLALGFDRSEDGFNFALTLMRRHYGKKNAAYVRNALERMTGHRFKPAPGIWKKWHEANLAFFVEKETLLKRSEWRKEEILEKRGVSARTERAVELGLAWLARHQNWDGRWSGDKFTKRCRQFHCKRCQSGARLGDWDVGMSGVSLLAFYGAGYRPDKGRYKDVVLRAQVYMAARQWADGDFGGQGDLIDGYSRPIAAIALAEAYGTTRDPEYRERARRSVAHIIRIQYEDAGWRYRLGGQFPGDTSVTGWNAWAISTAKKFGIRVDPMGIEGSRSLIARFSSVVTQDEEFYNTDPAYFFEVGRGQVYTHWTGYNAQEGTRHPMTAIGLICRIFMGGHRSHPYCIGAANTLLRNIPEYDERANRIKPVTGAEYPVYYWYYGSLAMYQMGGRFWRKWSRPFLTEGIPSIQVQGDECELGSWDCDNLDSIGGRVYTTAMTVLTLETFYRYLPMLGN